MGAITVKHRLWQKGCMCLGPQHSTSDVVEAIDAFEGVIGYCFRYPLRFRSIRNIRRRSFAASHGQRCGLRLVQPGARGRANIVYI